MYAIYFWLMAGFGIVAVFLLRHKKLSMRLRYPGLFLLLGLALWMLVRINATFTQLGLSMPTMNWFLFYFVATIIVCGLIIVLNKLFFTLPKNAVLDYRFGAVLFYVTISSILQEFLFRSYVYYSLNVMGMLTTTTMVLVSTFLFGMAHLAYHDKSLIAGSFVLGVIWSILYYLVPNLWLVSLSHAIIGLLAFQQGFIKPKSIFNVG